MGLESQQLYINNHPSCKRHFKLLKAIISIPNIRNKGRIVDKITYQELFFTPGVLEVGQVLQLDASAPEAVGVVLSMLDFDVLSPASHPPVPSTLSTSWPSEFSKIKVSPPLLSPPWPKLVTKFAETSGIVSSLVLSIR